MRGPHRRTLQVAMSDEIQEFVCYRYFRDMARTPLLN